MPGAVGCWKGMRFWIRKRVPTNSDTTAIINVSFSTTLNRPGIRGMRVFTDTSSIILLISSLPRTIGAGWTIPCLFIKRFFPGPGDSTLRTVGSLRIREIFPKSNCFNLISETEVNIGVCWGFG